MELNSHDVRALNDKLALRHDIDAYYAESNFAIRWIEAARLRWIAATANVQPGERVLEVGCGGGHILKMFPQAELTGVDVSGRMLEKSRRNLSGFRVNLLQGELEEVRLPAESFDVIVCSEVLEHVVDPDEMLRSMRRLLRPTGRAIITIPNDHLIESLKRTIVQTGLSHLPMFRRISWGGDEFHLHRWTLAEASELISREFAIHRCVAIPSRFLSIRRGFQCHGK
ncbi:MAG: class I SAM-dependent methyltransferase [Planctomycetes bacterium]|nr:class I SAM-dependent methyltransferase [Planctomycetota bacterium]MBI3832847.1 class I SAM-dependent methyltransferase [Planctomycetota bacterium]